jgi:hypothetical protein
MAIGIHLETKFNQPKIAWLQGDGTANPADWVLSNRIRIRRYRIYGLSIDQLVHAYAGLLLGQGGSWITIWQWEWPKATAAQPRIAYTETWMECNFILEAGSTIELFGQATAAADLTVYALIEYEDVV